MRARWLRSHWVGVPILLLASVGAFQTAMMIVDRESPIRYEDAVALSDSVPQGGTIWIEYEVVRDRLCDITVRRHLTDAAGEVHVVPTYTVGFPRDLGRERYERQITVPESAAVGPARYDVTLRYACNVIHHALGWPIEVHAPPITFLISPGDFEQSRVRSRPASRRG